MKKTLKENINKYNLTPKNILKLKVNKDLVNEENGFWRNNAINAWCISDYCGNKNLCDESEYWLGIYDELTKQGKDKIKLDFSCHGGMCSYNFKKFFNPEEIENEDDYKIQYMFIEKMNELIEKGVFTL